MSNLYPDLTFTNFPDSVDNFSTKSNITNATDAALVGQIQQYILSGDFSAATNIINNNQQLLNKIFSANDYNGLRDAIIALQRFFNTDITTYLSNKQVEWSDLVNQFSYKGVYNGATQYYKNNLVSYTIATGTFMYLCIQQPPVGTPPTSTSYWKVETVQGERGVSGSNLTYTYAWSSATNYTVSDIAVYNNAWWVATQPSQNKTPAQGSSYWSLVLTALPAIQIPVQSSQPSGQVAGDQWYKINS